MTKTVDNIEVRLQKICFLVIILVIIIVIATLYRMNPNIDMNN